MSNTPTDYNQLIERLRDLQNALGRPPEFDDADTLADEAADALTKACRQIVAQELALEDMEKWMDATQTDSYVQRVPDKCDRIIWRNRYIQLSE